MVDDAGDLAEASLRRQVGRREHADDVRECARGIRVDLEARVRVDATRECHVEGPRQAQVVDIEGLAAQQPRILEAPYGLAGEFVGHVVRRGAQL